MISERGLQQMRDEIKIHYLSIRLYKFKYKILLKQAKLTDLSIFEDKDEREGYIAKQFDKLNKYLNEMETCYDQIGILKEALTYHTRLDTTC